VLHVAFSYTALANPPESLKSGNYGHPPKTTWWLKQSLIYFFGLLGMKLCVFVIFQLMPWLGWVGDWLLRPFSKPWMQITFVMLIFPLIMNAMQYYIIDSFIKDSSGSDYEAAPGDDIEEDEHEGLIRGRRDSEDELIDDTPVSSDSSRRRSLPARTKEANPTPIPVEVDLMTDGEESSSLGKGSLGADDDKKK
jgi:hypothetical protein